MKKNSSVPLRTSPVFVALAVAIVVVVAALVSPLALSAQAKTNEPRALALIQDVENKLNVEGLDLTSVFTLIQKKQGETDRVLKLRVFRRDAASRFTILFQFPDSEKGKGYFRNGDDLYLYLPSTREFVYRNRKDDVGSTDVRTDLFGRLNLSSQYFMKLAGTEKVSKFDTQVVQLDAKTPDVSFPIQKWYLRSSDNLPVKVENFSASGTLLRTFFYIDYRQLAPGKYINTKLMAVNNLENNQRTLLSSDDISTAKIADYTFSQAFLEEQSR